MCLLLMQAQAMSSPEELQRRWQVVLSYHGGSAKLWREHLQWQRAQYASFAVPQLHASYQNAVQVGSCRPDHAHTDRQTELLAIHHGGYHALQLDSRPLIFFPLLLMSSSSVFFWILGSTGHAHVGHAYGVNHPSHSSSVNHAAASTEGVNIMNAAMLVTSGGPQKQASNSHTVPTITAQLLTLPCIRGVMPLALSHDNDR